MNAVSNTTEHKSQQSGESKDPSWSNHVRGLLTSTRKIDTGYHQFTETKQTPMDSLLGKIVQKPQWSDSINEILPGLFVGDYFAATCSDTLKMYNIEAIVNATWSSNKRPLKSKIAYHRVKIKDDGSSVITPHLARTNRFIHRQRRKLKKNVLIHCSAGMSRSVSLAIAYLFYTGHSSTFEEALKFMQTKRLCSRPSPSFTEELKAAISS